MDGFGVILSRDIALTGMLFLFQRILGSSLDPKLQYFGRSLDCIKDLNDDTLPDVSVGAYGKVVQLW